MENPLALVVDVGDFLPANTCVFFRKFQTKTWDIFWKIHFQDLYGNIWSHVKSQEIIFSNDMKSYETIWNHMSTWKDFGPFPEPFLTAPTTVLVFLAFRWDRIPWTMNGNLSTPPLSLHIPYHKQTQVPSLSKKPSPWKVGATEAIFTSHPPVSLARTPRLWLRIWLRRPGGQWSKASKRRVTGGVMCYLFLVGNRSLVNKRPCSFFVV